MDLMNRKESGWKIAWTIMSTGWASVVQSPFGNLLLVRFWKDWY